MKQYIDGIKMDKGLNTWFGKMFAEAEQSCMRLTIRPVKHIPITYYKPLIIIDDHLSKMTNPDNLKWVDGKPYEIVTLKKEV